MPSFERQAPSFDVTPVAGAVARPDTTAADLLRAGAQVASVVQQQSEAEGKATREAESNALLNDFEDSLFSTRDKAQQSFADKVQVESQDPDLNSDDERILKQATRISARLDRLEASGKSADVVQRRMIAEYQRFKAAAPHLTPELRDLFKKQTGKAVLQTMVELEQSDAAAAVKEAQNQKNFYIDFLTAHSMYRPGLSVGEMAVMAEPMLSELRELDAAKRNLELQKTKEDTNTGSRRVVQSHAFRQGMSGMVIAVNQSIQNSLVDFDPTTATTEQRQQLRDQLLNRKHLNEIEIRDMGPDLDATFIDKRVNVLNDQFDQAISYVDGKTTLDQLKNHNSITNQIAVNRLMETPGLPLKIAALNTLKGVDAMLLRAGDQLDIATHIALPAFKALMDTVVNPEANPYEELKGGTDKRGQVDFYKKLVEGLNQNLDNPEGREAARNSIEAWTNQMGIDPTNVPTGVLSQVFNLSSQPGWLELQKGGLNLNHNVISALKEYGARIQNKMGEDLSSTLSGVAKVPAAMTNPTTTSFKNSFLGVDVTATVPHYPRVLDVLDVRMNPDGSIAFNPVQGLTRDPKVLGIASDVTKKYGTEFGKMVRTYAHTVQGDQNYEKAYTSIIQSPGMSEFANAQQNPDVQERIFTGTLEEVRKMIEEADKQ